MGCPCSSKTHDRQQARVDQRSTPRQPGDVSGQVIDSGYYWRGPQPKHAEPAQPVTADPAE